MAIKFRNWNNIALIQFCHISHYLYFRLKIIDMLEIIRKYDNEKCDKNEADFACLVSIAVFHSCVVSICLNVKVIVYIFVRFICFVWKMEKISKRKLVVKLKRLKSETTSSKPKRFKVGSKTHVSCIHCWIICFAFKFNKD